MAIRNEFRLHVESDEATSLELSASEPDGEFALWISTPHNGHGEHELFLRLTRAEALELKAVLGVLTDTADSDEEKIVGGVS
jgi:hypothetical protein